MSDQAIFISLVAVVLLIVIGRVLGWLGRVLLLALVTVTVIVWIAPGPTGRWLMRGRQWAEHVLLVDNFKLER